jgi:hypothetical protein
VPSVDPHSTSRTGGRLYLFPSMYVAATGTRLCATSLFMFCVGACQVIDKSLEAQVLKSDNSSLARDCRRDMQQLNR